MARKRDDVYRQSMLNPHFPGSSQVLAWDAVSVLPRQRLCVAVMQVTPERPQGVGLAVNVGAGHVAVGDTCSQKVMQWVHQGDVFFADVETAAGILTVSHGWIREGLPRPTVFVHSDYTGMIVEFSGGKRVYRCNNGRLEQPFDKLVFSLELLPAEAG